LSLLDAGGRGKRARASARRLKAALAGLQGCFYGLSRVERRVIVLRTGLRGGRSHSRTDVARRLGTSRGQVRRVERRAVRKLYELVRTDGCAAGASGGGSSVITAGGLIGPAELAAAPALIAFGNPAYQASSQVDPGKTDFSQLGESVEFPSPSRSVGEFTDRSGNGIVWALQLLAIMLLVALGGFTRAAPLIAARARPKLAGLRRRYGLALRRRPIGSAVTGLLARANGKLAGGNGKAAGRNGQPARANGRHAAANGQLARPNGRPARVNGRHESPNGELAHGTRTPESAPEPEPEQEPAATHETRPPRSKVSV
jgi:sigma-70-like protein